MTTVKFYIRDTKIKGKLREDEVRIIARISIDGQGRFELRTKEKIIPRHWDSVTQKAKSTLRGHYELNDSLDDFRKEIRDLFKANQKLPFIKFQQLCKTKYAKKHRSNETELVEKKTLFIAMDQFLSQYKAEKDSKTLGKYNVLAKQLKKYDLQHDIDFQNLDFKFYDGFKTFLFAIPNPNYRGFSLMADNLDSNTYNLIHSDDGLSIGLFDDTVYKYFVNLKTFLAWAEKRGHQVNQSYKSWEIIQRKHAPISLTLAELEKLENFEFTIDAVQPFVKKHGEVTRMLKALEIARDYLVFECRTGQRISDIKRFDYKDYADFKWTFTPRKGNRISRKTNTVHFKGFCAPALLILQKYDWKMPVVSEQKINDNIKTACKIAGINQEVITYRWAQNKRIKIVGPKYEFLSTHCGRRSFVTIAMQFMSHKIVKDLAGIESWSTLKHYEGASESDAIEQALEKVPTTNTLMRKAN